MDVSKVGDGLWRFAVPHPDWNPAFDRPGGWGQVVAAVYAEFAEAVVLIDPLVPAIAADSERFWRALDRDVLRLARPALVLVGSVDHGRSADAVAERYRAQGHDVRVVGDAAIRDGVSCSLDATLDEVTLPLALHAVSIAGLSPGETAFVLDPWRAVVFADAVIGAGEGQVRVAPPSWGIKTSEGRRLYDREFRAAIARLAATRPEILLPSHGEPVLSGGADALADALASPPWGG